MRLAESTREAVIEVLSGFSPPPGTRLYLFGSRVREDLRGGDIDLAWEFPSLGAADGLRPRAHYVLAALKSDRRIGDRRIDLKIFTLDEAATDEFLRLALEDAVLLKEW